MLRVCTALRSNASAAKTLVLAVGAALLFEVAGMIVRATDGRPASERVRSGERHLRVLLSIAAVLTYISLPPSREKRHPALLSRIDFWLVMTMETPLVAANTNGEADKNVSVA